ncbi:MAG: glycosyltransferase family 1 protein [Chloroflexota bacterium]|nr:MAG: glycosyltransferase family 1 protein [Chloroflexota bacterium]
MRLCYLTRTTPEHSHGGLERHLEMIAMDSAARGNDVVVITTAHPRLGGTVVNRPDGIEVNYLAGTCPGRYTSAWWHKSVEQYAKLHHEKAFDLVVAEDGAGWSYTRLRARGGVSTPVVMFRHGTTLLNIGQYLRHPSVRGCANTFLNVWHLMRWARRYGPYVDAQIAVSDHVRESVLRESSVAPQRVHVIRNGVDVDQFAPAVSGKQVRARFGIPQDEPLVLWMGRLIRAKGWQIAYQTFLEVQRKNPRMWMLLVGSGRPAEEHRLAAMIREHGMQGRVAHLAGVPHEDVPEYLSAADVFLFPTYHPEGLPILLLEAMSSGKVCVCTDSPAIRQLIRPGTGLLAENDVPALARQVRLALEDSRLRESIGRAARDVVLRDFNSINMLDRIHQVYIDTTTGAMRQRV